jgi:triacylglycerol lipase
MFRFYIIAFLCLATVHRSWSKDLSQVFKEQYKKDTELSKSEKELFSPYRFYLIPGILSETFIWSDKRSTLDFSFLTSDYFSAHEKYLIKNGFNARTLSSSSKSVDEIKENIRKAVIGDSSKVFFITHSLGGLALLEELILNEQNQNQIAGIIFLQSPFSGTPVANTFLSYPYHIDKWIRPVLPFLNTSEETISYLRTDSRTQFMNENKEQIQSMLKKIPVITVGGVANGSNSLFKPSVDLIKHGCIRGLFNRCQTKILYQGPYDDSDGMVPYKSSFLYDSDNVKLEGVDHGETVVSIPFGSYKKESVLVTLMKLMSKKLTEN